MKWRSFNLHGICFPKDFYYLYHIVHLNAYTRKGRHSTVFHKYFTKKNTHELFPRTLKCLSVQFNTVANCFRTQYCTQQGMQLFLSSLNIHGQINWYTKQAHSFKILFVVWSVWLWVLYILFSREECAVHSTIYGLHWKKVKALGKWRTCSEWDMATCRRSLLTARITIQEDIRFNLNGCSQMMKNLHYTNQFQGKKPPCNLISWFMYEPIYLYCYTKLVMFTLTERPFL